MHYAVALGVVATTLLEHDKIRPYARYPQQDLFSVVLREFAWVHSRLRRLDRRRRIPVFVHRGVDLALDPEEHVVQGRHALAGRERHHGVTLP